MTGATASLPEQLSATGPYKGLANYTEEDAAFFFGRDREREVIIANLKARRLTLMYGESGVGKSSLLRAGVAADLLARAHENLKELGTPEYLPVVYSSWRDDPAAGLVAAIDEAVARVTGQPAGLSASMGLEEAIQAAGRAADAYLLIILDQFEEYFLYHPGDEQPDPFAEQFPRAINRVGLQASFLVAIREDALAKLDGFKREIPKLFDNSLRIDHLDADAARDAIVQPVEEYNRRAPEEGRVSLDPALVDAVLNQVRTGQVVLEQAGQGAVQPAAPIAWADDRIETPYLQLVMSRLWDQERRQGSLELRSATLDALGGAQEIVRTHLDAALSNFAPAERDVVADLFHHLVTPSGTKIAHGASDLAEYVRRPEPQVAALLEKLAAPDTRIVRALAPPPGDDRPPRYEIFHDVLAPSVLDWRSRQTSEAERRRLWAKRRRLIFRTIAVALVLVTPAVAALAIWALAQRQNAQTEATDAQSLALSADANFAMADNPYAPLVLSLAALAPYRAGSSSPTNARATMARALQNAQSQGLIAVLQGPTTPVTSVAFSPDGHTLATGTNGGKVLLWDTANHTQLASLPTRSPVTSVAFSPDGHTLATGIHGGKVLLRDTANHTQLASLPTGSTVNSVAFTPGGRTLAAGSNGGNVLLWDTANHARLASLPTGSPVNSVAFSPDGHTLATGTYGGAVLLWDTANHTQSASLQAVVPVSSVAFSPDGRTLATGTYFGSVLLWDTANHRQLASLPTGSPIYSVAFTPDGRALAAGTTGGNVLLWDTANRARLASLPTGSPVNSVAFSPDGHTLAAGTNGGKVLLWDTASHRQLASLSTSTAVYSVAFSPDGHTLAAGTNGGAVLLWDTANHTQPAFIPAGSSVFSVAFSPDGRTLAAGTNGGNVQQWDAASHTELVSHPAGSPVNSVAFSPDGRTLAVATIGGTVRLLPGERLWHSFAALRSEVCRMVPGGLTPTIRRTYAAGIGYHDPCP